MMRDHITVRYTTGAQGPGARGLKRSKRGLLKWGGGGIHLAVRSLNYGTFGVLTGTHRAHNGS